MAAWMFNKADTTIGFAGKANFVSYLVFITISNMMYWSFKFVFKQLVFFSFFLRVIFYKLFSWFLVAKLVIFRCTYQREILFVFIEGSPSGSLQKRRQ